MSSASEILILDCNHVYIGETFRALRIRLNEHQSHINRELGKSSIADHATTTRHNVNFEHASVICLQPNTTKRKISEALLIKAHTVVESNTPSISLALF